MCTYSVEVIDFGATASERVAYVEGVSLTKARRIVERAARRGLKRYGGNVTRNNWGSRGGTWPHQYRSATIRLHTL